MKPGRLSGRKGCEDMKLCMGCMENIEDNITTCPYCGYDETTLRQESYYLPPGTVVGGKYIVGRVMNYGGYTIAYLGLDAEANRKVIVKEYLPSDFSTRSEGETEVTIYSGDALEQFNQGLTTFLNEANRIQQLGSVQGIARVYDCVAENDTGYVISEYLEGQTLKEMLEDGRTYTPQQTKDFICQILTGLCKVHPMDIIHCDIAPETIMVTNTGEIKLLDFGATRYVTTANSKSLAIILKQGYAPEEQYRSRGVRGPWTDVYALGAVMYRMITGKVPEESVDRALVDELKEPSKLGIDIPENIENAMMNALNVYQNERTPSAEVFLKELQSPQVKRIQVKKRKNDTGKFPKWAKGLVAGLLCLALAGGVTAYMMWPQAEDQGTDNTKRMRTFVGMSLEEAQKALEEENYAESGIKVSLIDARDQDAGKFVYDSNPENDGKICRQETRVVSENPEQQKNASETTISAAEALKDNGKYEVICTFYSNQKIHYSDLISENKKTINAKVMADTMKLESKLNGKEADAGSKHIYWDLDCIQLNNGTSIKEQDLLNGDKNSLITVADIKAIEYFKSAFFYWKSLPNFKEKMGILGPDEEETLYEYESDGKTLKKTERKEKLDSAADKNYYSYKLKKNTIIGQTVNPGQEYNVAAGSDPYFLRVVNEMLPGNGITVKKFCDTLSGFNNVDIKVNGKDGSGNQGDYIIQGVPTVKDAKNNPTDYFSKNKEGEHYTIEVTAKKPEPTPAPTPAPTQYVPPNNGSSSNSSSSSGGSSYNKGSSGSSSSRNSGSSGGSSSGKSSSKSNNHAGGGF